MQMNKVSATQLFLVVGAFVLLSGFSVQKKPGAVASQPADERAAQDALPKSQDPMWDVLTRTKIHVNEKAGLYSATYPPEVKAMVGKEMTISGFILPLESADKFKHFILSKRTPTCPFCPPGEPNEIIDVYMQSPIAWDEDSVKISGKFELMNNPELGMFFRLTGAKKI